MSVRSSFVFRSKKFVVALGICVLTQFADATAQCLFAGTQDASVTDSEAALCIGKDDPEDLTHDPDIQKAIHLLDLDGVQIRFQGCAKGVFGTRPAGARGHSYRISYPVLTASRQNDADQRRTRYFAPITHELAHVTQLEKYGGLDSLVKQRPILSIELSADFMSGMLFDRLKARDRLNDFQQNIALVGLYREDSKDAHGTWEQRTWSFRRGVFWKDTPEPLSPRNADAQFLANVYPEVTHLSNLLSVSDALKLPQKLELNKISACKEVEQLYQELRTATRPLSVCRAPHSTFEQAVAAHYNKGFGPDEACLLSRPPSQILAGYSCFQLKSNPSSVDCLRQVSQQVLSDQFSDNNKEPGRQYREQAGLCGADAAPAVPTLFPLTLDRLFKFEFGYRRSLGPKVDSPGQMTHGVASAIRKDRTGGVDTIEFVTAFTNGAYPKEESENSETYGNWRVSMAGMDDVSRKIERRARDQHVPLSFRMIEFSIKRLNKAPRPDLTREAQVQQWQDRLGNYFKTELFHRIPTSKLRTPEGKDIFTALQELRKSENLPDGIGLSPNIYAYVSQSAHGCTKDEQGVIFGLVFATELPVDINDYGSVVVGIIGGGNCGRKTPFVKQYFLDLVEEARNTVRNVLKESP